MKNGTKSVNIFAITDTDKLLLLRLLDRCLTDVCFENAFLYLQNFTVIAKKFLLENLNSDYSIQYFP